MQINIYLLLLLLLCVYVCMHVVTDQVGAAGT